MRMTIKADKRKGGYVMIAVSADGVLIEEPQEGLLHSSRKSIYATAALMYAHNSWDYNPVNHTIETD